jgi:hypothetical protein
MNKELKNYNKYKITLILLIKSVSINFLTSVKKKDKVSNY